MKNACVNVDDDNINEDRLSWTGSLGQRFSFDMAAILTDVVKAASAAAPSSSSSTSLPLSSTLVASNPVLPITKYYSGCGGGSLAPSLYDNDIHVLTGTIKSFLRDGMLPDGQALCTDALYGDFIDAARKGNESVCGGVGVLRVSENY